MENEKSPYSNVDKSHGDSCLELYCVVLHQTIDITRCFIICCDTGEFITFHEEKNDTVVKKEGYKEISAGHLIEKATACIRKTLDNYFTLNHQLNRLASFALCTQSNVTVVWSKSTGRSLYAALSEDDIRCDDACQKLIQTSWKKSITIHHLCGLPISARWAGVKLRWLLDNIGPVKEALSNNDLMCGTLDSWLLWNLTSGATYATDVTNASYTMLMNLHRSSWDSIICKFLDIDPAILPEIRSCAEPYGRIADDSPCGLAGLPITGVICDIKASVLGHQGTQAGCVNLHIDPGSSSSRLSIVVGEEPVFYRPLLNGVGSLISTACFQLGQKDNVVFALEASIHNSENVVPWLRHNARLLSTTDSDDLDSVFNSVPDSGGLFFLPSTGSYPDQSRHVSLLGLNLTSSRPGHIVRAALESIAIEVAVSLTAISTSRTLPSPYKSMTVSGPHNLARSDAFCQMLADYSGLAVSRMAMTESVVGAALLAVLGARIDPSGLRGPLIDRFQCLMVPGDRKARCSQWSTLANEQELLTRRHWIGCSDDLVHTRSNRNSGKPGPLSRRAGWTRRILTVLVIGAPFTLLGFGAALCLSRGRMNLFSGQ